MNLTLQYVDMHLGITSDNDAALMLDLLPVDIPVVASENKKLSLAAFCPIVSEDKTDRIIKLLTPLIDKLLLSDMIDFTLTPTYWLLPELNVNDNNADLITWASLLKAHFPLLFSHPKSQLFPYGRSALSISLSVMQNLLQDAEIKQVCVIAVDSLFHEFEQLIDKDITLDRHSGEGIIPSEGAVIACFSSTSFGLDVMHAKSERATVQQKTQAIEHLFYQVSQTLSAQARPIKLSAFYAPSNGQAGMITPWLDAYVQLASHVDNKTELKQLALLSGELGCVTGLYHLLHVYHAYDKGLRQGSVLQLDISNTLYQSVNLYAWTNKEFI